MSVYELFERPTNWSW